MTMPSACPFSASDNTYAPFSTNSAALSECRGYVGTFCRVSTNTLGPSVCSKATLHACETSLASAGRNTKTLGMARMLAKCSTG